jgi:hypothetical protein
VPTDDSVDVAKLYRKDVFKPSLQRRFIVSRDAQTEPGQSAKRQNDDQNQQNERFGSHVVSAVPTKESGLCKATLKNVNGSASRITHAAAGYASCNVPLFPACFLAGGLRSGGLLLRCLRFCSLARRAFGHCYELLGVRSVLLKTHRFAGTSPQGRVEVL